MLINRLLIIVFSILSSASCKPNEGQVETAVIRECIRNGDVTLSEFMENSGILHYGRLEEFERVIREADERFEILPLAEFLSTPKPECQMCRGIEYDDFRYIVWRSGADDSVFRRFRAYINAGELLCVETDFGYRNPY